MLSAAYIDRAAEAAAQPVARPVGARPCRPLRVLVVAFQAGKQADGGLESLTQLLERYEDLQVTVLSQAETAKNARWRRAGAKVLVWPMWSRPKDHGVWRAVVRTWRYFLWNLHTARLVATEGFDVAHVNDHQALWHTILGLRVAGIPVVYNIRDTKPGLSGWEFWKWRWAFRLTQAQIVLSGEMREFWRRSLRIRGRDLVAIYSVVDFQRMAAVAESERDALRARLGLPRTFVAGYVASFSKKKAQLRFIQEAGPELKRRMPHVQIWFLGDFEPDTDPYAAACLRATRDLGLGAEIVFKGFVDPIEHWYPALDAVIVGTRNEGLARCMIEAIACGTPVVSFDVCSAREILERGGCGIVVPQGDYAGLVAAIGELAATGNGRGVYGLRGVEVARRIFDPVSNVAKYVAVYESLATRGEHP